jgi:methionyl-tRNA synthetase
LKIIVTSALPYSYAVPHLGNFVGSVLPADVYFKHLKMNNADAIFICGSDEHGTPIELRAIEEKRSPEELADEVHEKMKELFAKMHCSFTYYGKTHCNSNKETVYEIFKKLYANGYIQEQETKQAYCKVDKRFLLDRLIEGTCPYCGGLHARGDQCDDCGKLMEPENIINPKCRICGKSEIEFRTVKNLALSLDKLQEKVKKFIEKNDGNLWSKTAVNKPLSYIESGLKPRDITRKMNWGFPVPLRGYDDSVFYVWFDAIIGYIGITREWNFAKAEEYWKGKETQLIQFMGKDNIEFHTLMWPAVLIGADEGYALPRTIKASEYLISHTVKFSKSRGVGLNMENALEVLKSDYWRFVLMYLYPETSDSEFSIDLLVEIVNTIMNDKIGNLVQRVLKFAGAHQDIVGGEPKEDDKREMEIILEKYVQHFSKIELREALHDVIAIAGLGNSILSNRKPWELIKDPEKKEEVKDVMNSLIAVSYYMSIMLWPFTPEASVKILSYFGISDEPSFSMFKKHPKINFDILPEPVFTKIDEEDIKKLEKFS